jgi:carbon monoxide dehydrogenase subunit G
MTVTAPLERVWRVLTAFEEMPAHLSALKQSRTLKQRGNYRLVEQVTKAHFAFLPISFRVVMEVVERRPFLYFTQREGSFAVFNGHWRVDPNSVGNWTRIRYYLEVAVGHGLGRLAAESQLKGIIHQNLYELSVWMEYPQS